MNRLLSLFAAGLCAVPAVAADVKSRPVASGLTSPAAVAATADGRVFVSSPGERDRDGDGAVFLIQDGKAQPFATGFDDPAGLIAYQQWLYVADRARVRRVDLKTGEADVYADAKDFPTPPKGLGHLAVDENGILYVGDAGGSIFRIAPKGFGKQKGPTPPKALGCVVKRVADAQTTPALKAPAGLVMDSMVHLLVLDSASGELLRVRVTDGASEKVADGFQGGAGIVFDRHGRLYLTSATQGKLWSIPRPLEKPVVMAEGFGSPVDVCLDGKGKGLLVADAKAGAVVARRAQPPGWEVDERPLPLETAVSFPELKWTGWESGDESGKVVDLRPLVLTHANDNSGRNFVAIQQGIVHVFPNDQKAARTKVFLDISPRVFYSDNENEQGLLGMTFHPKYKENGEFFVFYTDKRKRLNNVLSRFRVSKDDPDRADPNSEEELLRINHKYWNHDGGTVVFGPDGYLYVVLGDGGAANDPDDNGQNLSTLLGKVLRLDVDHKGDGKPYAIPKDNPFVGRKDARPEIYAYGLRNPWRMAFDRWTGMLWAADVGQNLWEEIDHITAGGNYGWRRREGLHPFWTDGTGARPEYIEPIWEYHHDIGKSITGGAVYRGKQFPELEGHYLYADYVTGKIWALKYDEQKKRVVANRPIKDRGLPIMSFGEDQDGELYLMTYSPSGKGVYRFVRSEGVGKK